MIVNQKSIMNLKLFSDLLVLDLTFFVSGILAQSLELMLAKDFLFILLILLNVIWYFSARITHLYSDFNIRRFSSTAFVLAKNVLIQVFFSLLFIFFSKELLFTRNFILFNGIILFSSIFLSQILFNKIFTSLRNKNSHLRNAIIIGTGESADKLKRILSENPAYGYNFSGYVSFDSQNAETTNFLGDINSLNDIIIKNDVKDVIVSVGENEHSRLEEIVRVCDRNAVKCYVIPDYLNILSKRFQVSSFADLPVISIRTSALEEAQNRLLKRAFDIIFSLITILVFLWWLVPLIALAIKLTSKGPVFFIQDRVGRDETRVKILKFRSMTIQASSNSNSTKPVETNDVRITRIGKILRRTNLDEIPQFFDVLLGKMSIVGPRPHAIAFNNEYKAMVEEIKLRNRVKPGITGWAQIHGLRGDVDDYEENRLRMQKRISFDIWYIENWSLWMDVQIIFETILQTFSGKNKGV